MRVSRKSDSCAMAYFESLIQRKKRNGYLGTAELYGVALHEFLRAIGLEERGSAGSKNKKPDPGLKFSDFTRANLEVFDEGMKQRGLEQNTANTYWSNLRAMFHRAEIDRIIEVGVDPFRYRKIQMIIPYRDTMSEEEIIEFSTMDLSAEPKLERSRDINDFCFIAQGMPYIDLARLTPDNLKPHHIVYERAKTKMKVVVFRTPAINKILAKYMTTGPFLFPIIKGSVFNRDEHKVSLRTHNERLKRVAARMRVPIVITSYTMRHTWAKMARHKKVSLSAISASLGHASEKTTLHYLKGLDLALIAEANQVVTSEIEKHMLDSI